MKALLIVDVQKDFCEGGPLSVPEADSIVPVVNQLQELFDLVLATKDWHPTAHISFASTHGRKVGEIIDACGENQVLWPDHCVQNTKGSEFSDKLDPIRIEKVFYKGTNPKIDSYSGFFDSRKISDTGLHEYLKQQGISDVYIVGLATDYCVKYTPIDAADLGYRVYVIEDAVRGVDLCPGDVEDAFASMAKRGIQIVNTSQMSELGNNTSYRKT